MGPGAGARPVDCQRARELGRLVAERHWVLLTGGRRAGVMAAAMAGARAAGGTIVGILPGREPAAADPAVDIAICTDLGHGRNNVNALSATVVVACGLGLGTVSEIALALKNGRPVILLDERPVAEQFFRELQPGGLLRVTSAAAAIAHLDPLLAPGYPRHREPIRRRSLLKN